MLKIGEFSVLSGISIAMLRNYDKIGLLIPSHIDDINGYRYYDKDQLLIANQIVSMKGMGFGLEEIKSSFEFTKEELQKLFQKKIEEKKQEQQLIMKQLKTLKQTVQIEKEDEEHVALRVMRKTMPETFALSYRREIQEFHEEGILWKEMMKEVSRQKIVVNESALAISLWHERDEVSGAIDAEIMLYTNQPYEHVEPLTCKKIEQQEVASILFKGSYLQISKINTIIAKWLEANHYEIVSEPFTIYHKSPRENPNEATFLTEICFPIRSVS